MKVPQSIGLLLGTAAIATALAGCSQSADSHMARGDAQLANGRIDAAVLEFRSALEKDPMLAAARRKLADAYLRQGNGAGALAEYVRAADLLPMDSDAQLKAGSLLLLAGRPEQARARADKALAIDPNNADAHVLRGNALAGLTDFNAAIELVQKALALDPTASRQVNLGFLQQAKGQVEEAEAAFRRAVVMDPKSAPVRMALAQFLWSTGRSEEAETTLEAALAIDPENVAANRAMATLCILSNRTAQAEPYFKKLASGGDAPAMLALADYYVTVRRVADARAVLDRLSGAPATWPLARSKLAALMYSERNTAEAHRAINEVIAKQPAYSEAHIIRGRFLVAEGKTDEALAEFQQAIKTDPRNAEAHFQLGSILKVTRDLDGAAASFNEVLRLNPRASIAQVRLAEVQLLRGETATAVQLAEQAAERDPRALDARLVLARSLLTRGDLDRAAVVTRQLVEEFPQAGAVHVAAGLLAVRTGNRAAGRAAFEKALALDPRLLEPLAVLAALDVADGQGVRARGRIEDRLKKTPSDSGLLVVAARTWGATGDARKGEEFLRRAIDADATNAEPYELLARIYMSQNRLDQALTEYERLAALRPAAVGPATMAALILRLQGKQEEAQRRYERIVEAEPHAAVASNNLAWLYASRGEKLDRALELAQAAKAELPDVPQVNDTLGFVYLKKQLPSLAIPPLRLAVEKDGNNPVFRYHLGLAYFHSGDKVGAREALEHALRLKPDFDGAEDARKVLQSIR